MVGVSNDVVKNHGNRGWNVLTKAGIDGWTDRQTKAFIELLVAATNEGSQTEHDQKLIEVGEFHNEFIPQAWSTFDEGFALKCAETKRWMVSWISALMDG